MASVLDDIINSSLQQVPTAPNTSLVPSAPSTPMRPDSPANSSNESSSDSEDDIVDQGPQALSGIQDSPDPIAAFTINTARNFQLTANGEKSLLQFSRVFFLLPPA